MAALMGLAFKISGSVAPPRPQTVADEGYRRLWAGSLAAPNGAVPLFREAVISDSAFPWRWSDLGDGLLAAGNADEAAYCFRQSLALGPALPQIALRAANFDFETGRVESALGLGATILKELPDYDDMVFSSYVRMGGDLDRVLGAGVGNNPRAAGTFFQFLMRRGDEPALSKTWHWMDMRGYATRPLARSWANWLLQKNRPEEAAAVWKRHGATDAGRYMISNWIDNGSFESQWTGEGFDWQVEACPGVKTIWDDRVAHSGHRSLRLDLEAEDNLDFHHVSEPVWLEPGRWRLSSWIRTSGLTTDQGIGLRLLDPRDTAGTDLSTPEAAGTQYWTQISTEFTFRGPARLAKVAIVRRPSEKFDNRPRGTAWIDDVELRRLGD